ncbi:MAG: hypothetical protein ACRDSP_18955 [Pseudonocardiaceae bacterium]
MTTAGLGYRVWRRCWVLWRLDIPRWRHRAWVRVFWPAWRVRYWERKPASEVAECRAREVEVAAEFGGRVVPSPIWNIKESYYPSRLRAAWRWGLYRTPLIPVLSRAWFALRRLVGVARADGRNYVGYRARITPGLKHLGGLSVG